MYMLRLVMRCNMQQDPCKNQRVSLCSWAGFFFSFVYLMVLCHIYFKDKMN